MQNVVILTIDSLRADHCSCYGYERETTPNLDTLTEQGVRFENAFAPSSHTRESVPALLTGRYPHAAVDGNYHLAQPTLATMLKDTHHTGAFHSNPFLSRAYGYDREFDAFDDDLYLSRHKLVALAQRFWDKIRGHHYARAETINDRALEWLDSLPDDEPFFLWNHYMDVHGPYEPPEGYRSIFLKEAVSDSEARDLWRRAIDDPDVDTFDEKERKTLVALYDSEIRYVDHMIGTFLTDLFGRYPREETIVVVTSDHGDRLGEDGHYGHPRYLSETLLRVPLFLTGNDISATTVDTPTNVLAVVPTILDLLTIEKKELDTTPMALSPDTESGSDDEIVICEARGEDDQSHIQRYRAFDKTASHKCVVADGERVGSETNDPLAKRLYEHVERASTETHERGPETGSDVNARLEALGYK